MSPAHWLVVLSAFLHIVGSFAYIRDTLAGRTKPNRVSWSLWALASFIGTGAALAAHADPWTTIRIFMVGFIPFVIFLSSFINAQSYWKLTRFDMLCGLCSLIALFVWLGIDAPKYAILIAALGDGFACLPTLKKAWQFPETETGSQFIMSLLATLLLIPSIPAWNIENTAFQIYLVIADTLLIIAVYRKRIRFLPFPVR